ncbi:MAG: maleylpyruvate isomerase family mycothiol-dependent enzyme [Micropruina sp.]
MPNTSEFAELGEGIGNATAVIRNNAASAGLDVAVPTCPGWTMRDLVTHQGLVHRWATAILRGAEPRADDRVEAEAAAAADLLQWLDDGMVDLLNALAGSPADLDVWFFLPDAPAPRQAWARRQCHETSVHAIDAMAARLGRVPRADELWIAPALARDGIDELLLGFAPRPKYNPRSDRPAEIAVITEDGLGAWSLAIGPDGVSARAGTATAPDATIGGTAAAIYAGLWNRGDELAVDGDAALVGRFLDQLRVTWS